MTQLYVSTPFSGCISINQLSSDDDISNLRLYISSKFNVPGELLIFSNKSKILKDHTPLNSLTGCFIQANFSLLGGKGGFGSLLRGQAATKRKTTNFDSSRDLKGRRIRNVENEKKLKDFLRKKQEEDEKIKKELKEYKEMEQKQKKMQHEIKLTQEYKIKLEDWENKMGQSISVGLQKLKQEPSAILKTNNNGTKDFEGFEIPKKKICLEEHLSQKIKNLYQQENLIPNNFNNFEEHKQSSHQENIITEKNEEKTIKKKYDEIDLSNISTVEDLESFGPEHLKEELNRLGLKCGGNLKERAQRLFDIKKDPTNLFNPKYLAKKK